MSRLSGQRFPLDSELLNKILNSMDTEYDPMALKAVIFAVAVNFLSKVLTVADESENVFKAAEDIVKLRTRERIENVEKKIQNLKKKLDKSLLSERWKCELGVEKDALTERLAKLKDLEKKMKALLLRGKHSKESTKLLKILWLQID